MPFYRGIRRYSSRLADEPTEGDYALRIQGELNYPDPDEPEKVRAERIAHLERKREKARKRHEHLAANA